MRKKAINSLLLILIVMLSASGCGKKQKTSVLTNDVKQQEAMKENEIKKFIKDGTNFLNAGKYDDAKSSFEKAISMDKSNKGAYIEIKNKYMEKKRIDDAYYFIKLAVSNNVDTENMKKLLNDIKSKFEVTKLYVNVYENNEYQLPDKIKAKINNEDKEVGVVWNNKSVDTSKVGTIKYEGKIEQYDRTAELYLEIIEIKKEKEIKKENNTKKVKRTQKENKDEKVKEVKEGKNTGFICKVYEQNGKKYLKVDNVEFFLNKDINDKTAQKEAIKDGNKDLIIDNLYYIRNKDKNLETYEISPNAYIYICGHRNNLNALDLQKVNYESFENLRFDNESFLAHIYLENNIVVKIEEQYRP
ncbi:bacterial Ig-like domain family protein [Clostridium sporogenes]|uniref:Bacterial Ig-like domain family protein n=1 Tax=Clostridium sporogenes TaxID=1509 RepID=A0A1L3NCB4_CLOSG|nr:Ig-like domain-containing protein [Clostridium sporogenes]APH13755.1 bacterial Ig-like domain family protein [Clostridium sporogenes]